MLCPSVTIGFSQQFSALLKNNFLVRNRCKIHFFGYRRYESSVPRPARDQLRANNSNGNTVKLVLVGTMLGAAFGTAYSLYGNWKDKKAHMDHEQHPLRVLNKLPSDLKITKRYISSADTSGLEIILFQYQTCPFCCKVRAFLDYMGLSYSVVEVNAVLRRELDWSDKKKVPMVLVRQRGENYIQICDSSAIISLLASYMYDRGAFVDELALFYPMTSFIDDFGKKRLDILNKYFIMFQNNTAKRLTRELEENERKWRIWADNHLVHLISPNCYRTLHEALETFEWFSTAGQWDIHFPAWERNLMIYVGAIAMWIISKILKKRHNLTDDVRLHIYDALEQWMKELNKRGSKYMGGNEPNLADLSVFGVLCSMEGCRALDDCFQNTNIGEWYNNIKDILEKNRGQVVR